MTILFQTYFDLNLRQVRVLDQTNYAAQGVSLSDVKGVLTINTPAGIIHQGTDYNSPDIDPNTSLYSGYFNLPQDRNGYVRHGSYTVTYNVRQTSTLGISTAVNTYSYTFIVPEVVINQTPDGYNSTFTSVDETDYGVPTSFSRTHTVTPPSGSGLPTTANQNKTITYAANIWSATWVSVVTTVLTYSHGGLVLNLTLSNAAIPATIYAYNIDMNIIRGYIEYMRLDYYTNLNINRAQADKIKDRLLLLTLAYAEYDQALYYNDNLTAYEKAVNISQELNDYFSVAVSTEILPFNPQGSGGSTHSPVSIGNPSYGAIINANQVLSFSPATTLSGGMLPELSGLGTDYFGGDGAWHTLDSGGLFALKSDFADYAGVTAITATNILNWSQAYGWGNHSLAGYALLANVYTKTELQTPGSSIVDWANISNAPTLFDGTYGSLTGTPTLALVATTGQYTDLLNLPTLFDGAYSSLSGIPTFATVATTGSYNDLIDQPTIFDGTWASITGTPTTLAGYGITDAMSTSHAANVITGTDITNWNLAYTNTHTHANKTLLDTITDSGLGTNFLADDGTYKSIAFAGLTDKNVLFVNGSNVANDPLFTYDTATGNLSTTYMTTGQVDFIDPTVNITNTAGDMIFTDTHQSISLSDIVSGATNYWLATTGGIYYPNKVGVNSPPLLTGSLTVNGNVVANNFDSDYFRYVSGNLLIGVAAGAFEAGTGKLYIHNSGSPSPLIYGEFSGLLEFNADVFIPSTRHLNFTSSNVQIYNSTTTVPNNLTFKDAVANSGADVTLTSLTDGTFVSLLFADFAAVSAITAADIAIWNRAVVLSTGGSATKFLAEDGVYYTIVGGGGVIPIDSVLKWDTGTSEYRFYTDKTEAGGVASSGKFYGGTTDPSSTARVNYDGNFHATNLYGVTDVVAGSLTSGAVISSTGSFSTTLSSLNWMLLNPAVADSALAVAYKLDTADELLTAGSLLFWLGNQNTERFTIDKDGNVNIPAEYRINGRSLEYIAGTYTGTLATNAYYKYPQQTISAPVSLTFDTTGAFTGAGGLVSFVADGVNVPTFTNGTKSGGIYNNTAGEVNVLSYEYVEIGIVAYSWIIGASDSSLINPMTTIGDLIYGTVDGDPARLGVGSEGQVLTVVGGMPIWAAAGGGGGVTPTNGILEWVTNKYQPYATMAELGTNLGFYSDGNIPTTNHNEILGLNGRLIIGSNNTSYDKDTISSYSYNGSAGYFESTASSAIYAYTDTGYGFYSEANNGISAYVTNTGNVSSSWSLLLIGKKASGASDSNGTLIDVVDDSSTTTGVISGSLLKYTADSTIRTNFDPRVADSASAVAYMFDTHSTLSDVAARIFTFKNHNTELSWQLANTGQMYSVGGFYAYTNSTNYNQFNSASLITTISGTQVVKFNPLVVSTGSATAHLVDTVNALTTGDKLYSWKNQGTEESYVSDLGKYTFKAGTSTIYAVAGGVLKDFYTDVTTAGGVETILYTYDIPANTLHTDHDKISAKFNVVTSSATTTGILGYFANVSIGGFTGNMGSVSLSIEMEIMRTSSSAARVYITICTGNNYYTHSQYTEVVSKDWTAANTIKITGNAAGGSVTAKSGYITYIPAALN